jgi:hypothetical protein
MISRQKARRIAYGILYAAAIMTPDLGPNWSDDDKASIAAALESIIDDIHKKSL